MRHLLLAGVAVLLLAGLLLGTWWFGARQAPRGPRIAVTLRNPASVEENEVAIAQPVELALAGLPGLERMETRIARDEVTTRLWLERSAEPYAVLQGLHDRLGKPIFPPGLAPELQLLPQSEPVRWVIQSDQWTLSQLRTWAEQNVVRPLEMQPGARAVELCGVEPEEVVLRLDPLRAAAAGVTADQVLDAVAMHPFRLRDPPLAELLEQSIGAVRIADLATVERRPEPDRCLARRGGRVLLVSMRPEQPFKEPWSALPPAVRITRLPAVSTVGLWLPAAEAESRLEHLARAHGATEVTVLVHPVSGDSKALVEAQLLVAAPLDTQRAVELARALVAEGFQLTAVDQVPSTRMVLAGADREVLSRLALGLEKALGTPQTLAVAALPPRVPELSIVPDRDRLSRFGLSAGDVTTSVAMSAGGLVRGGVRLTLPTLAGPDDLARLRIGPSSTPGSGQTVLGEVARIELKEGPGSLLRVHGQPAVEVLVFGATDGLLRKAAQSIALPPGVTLELQ